VETTAANGHDLTPAAEPSHGEETVVCVDAGYQGIENGAEMEGRGIDRVLPCVQASDGLCPIHPMDDWMI
jgi:IS5 family transposase